MAWASSGGYPGIASGGDGVLDVPSLSIIDALILGYRADLIVRALAGGNLMGLQDGVNNSGLTLKYGIALFDCYPPSAPITGGDATAGSTYTAVEQGMLEAAYSALRSIGLIT